MLSNGFLPECWDANETWSAVCQSWVSTTLAKDFAKSLITGTIAAPSLTAKLPPGTKQFCTSITSKASLALTMSFAAGLAGAAAGVGPAAPAQRGAFESKAHAPPRAKRRRESESGEWVMPPSLELATFLERFLGAS